MGEKKEQKDRKKNKTHFTKQLFAKDNVSFIKCSRLSDSNFNRLNSVQLHYKFHIIKYDFFFILIILPIIIRQIVIIIIICRYFAVIYRVMGFELTPLLLSVYLHNCTQVPLFRLLCIITHKSNL